MNRKARAAGRYRYVRHVFRHSGLEDSNEVWRCRDRVNHRRHRRLRRIHTDRWYLRHYYSSVLGPREVQEA